MTVLQKLSDAEEVFWRNPHTGSEGNLQFTAYDIDDASERLRRFAPLIEHIFSETAGAHGMIESPLTEIENMRETLENSSGNVIPGRLFLKRDSDLPISGSVKARGGIYEVLEHTEKLALSSGLLNSTEDDILKLTGPAAKAFFARHKVQVGSTGNLGLSIGIMAAALGYEAIVHMSSDAKQWKKDLLRERGAKVIEYDGDYSEAVRCGRILSQSDPDSYFVDDENSRALFCGYAVAGRRLAAQLDELKVRVDREHPLMVYIPCGVGGAPGGITLGLKQIYGENVHVFFAEPVQAPCMLLGLASEKYGGIAVSDIGLTGKTQADGLAVGRCSDMAAHEMRTLMNGEFTVSDDKLPLYLKMLWNSEGLFIEPSACAAFECAARCAEALEAEGIAPSKNITQVVWATGGRMVPEEIKKELISG